MWPCTARYGFHNAASQITMTISDTIIALQGQNTDVGRLVDQFHIIINNNNINN